MTTKNEECLDSFQRDFGYKEERISMASGQVNKGVQQENCSRSFWGTFSITSLQEKNSLYFYWTKQF